MSTFIKSRAAAIRRAPRVKVDLEGSLVGRVAQAVHVVDLSAVGCLARCEILLDPGAILDLHLRLAEEPFEAKVRVVDSSVDGTIVPQGSPRSLTGLEFISVTAQDQARLRRFLDEERRRRRSADSPAE